MATLKNTTINDTGYLQLPSGTTAQRPSSPATGYMRWNTTESYIEVYNGTNWVEVSGSETPLTVDYLVVAGGGSGSGGYGDTYGGIGGTGAGAGGLRTSYGSTSGGGASNESQLIINPGTNYTVTVGAGGAGVLAGIASAGNSGSNSIFSNITSIGGGRGGSRTGAGPGNGGSGGGASTDTGSAGGLGTTNQGYNGGGAASSGNTRASASGGGAGSVGLTPTTANGANAGNGLSVSITGSAVTYAGGGGGGATTGGTGGTSQTGGNGGNPGSYGSAGTANTGGGGGGGGGGTSGGSSGAGGSGVVILRYPNAYTITIGSGLTGSTATAGSDKVTTFTAGTGTISFS